MTYILLSSRQIAGSLVGRGFSTLVAVLGVLALALSLGGCGRKGPLDPPPGGYVIEQGVGKTPTSRRGKMPEPEAKQEYDQDGRPILPEGRNKKLPADWLID